MVLQNNSTSLWRCASWWNDQVRGWNFYLRQLLTTLEINAYCEAKVHFNERFTTLTSQYYMDKAHAEWKPPLAETGNEKWQILSEFFEKKKKKKKKKEKVGIHLVLHEGSDPRPWGSAFPCCTTEATLQGTRWCSVSMVSDVVHQKTRNPEVWSLTAEEKLKLHRCP